MATPKIIRVELKGEPDSQTYKQLHALMSQELKWNTWIVSNTGVNMSLPSATYSGQNEKPALELALQLRDLILKKIWNQGVRVLVIDWAVWGEATTTPW